MKNIDDIIVIKYLSDHTHETIVIVGKLYNRMLVR